MTAERGTADSRNTDPLPVAFLVSTLTTGGAERQLEHLVLALRDRGIAPRIYTLRDPGAIGESLARRGVPLESRLAPGRLPSPRAPVSLAARLRRHRIRCLYCLDHTNAVATGVVASKLAGSIPVFVAVHTTAQWDRPSIPAPVRALLGGITRFIAIAETQRRYLVDAERIPPAKITVIRNGIPPLDPVSLPSRESARTAIGIALDEGPVIGIVAMLRPEKGHEVFLEAAKLVVDEMPRAVFLIVGDGPRRDELAGQARTLGISERVRFLGRRDDVPHVLRAFDLSVLSSHPRVETLPLSQMEAMSLEVPVLATRVGALHELVEDGIEGRLAPPGEPRALAVAMLDLLRDPERMRAMGTAARRKILASFTIDRAARETVDLIEGTILT